MDSAKNTGVKRILRFLPMFLIMVGIFAFSALPGDESADQSGSLLDAIIKLFGSSSGDLSENTYRALHLLLRKTAHFTEYALLGASACYAFKLPRLHDRRFRQLLFPWVLSTAYAVTDEIHQYYVSGRYGTWSDVLIDSAGAVTGILIWSLIMKKHGKLTDTQKQ